MTIVIHKNKAFSKNTSDFHMYSSTKSPKELHFMANKMNILSSNYALHRRTPKYKLTVNQAYWVSKEPGVIKSGW